jgi:hypothetical protein
MYCLRDGFTHLVISCHSGLDPESMVSCANRNPVSLFIDPCFRRDDVWIPTGVYPVLDTGRE